MEEYDDIKRLLAPRREIKASAGLRRRVDVGVGNHPMIFRPSFFRALWWGGSLSAVAAVLLLLLLPPRLTANEVLSSALDSFREVADFSMTVEVRTRPNENFAHIGIGEEFVRHRLNVSRRDSVLRWSMDKGGRGACGDTTGSYTWVNSLNVGWHTHSGPERFLCFLSGFLNPEKIIEGELTACRMGGVENCKVKRRDGLLELTVTCHPQGDFSNPYMLNATIKGSENIRKYLFDPASGRLVGASVHVVDNGRQTEVLRITGISYGMVDEAAFGVPRDVRFIEADAPGVPEGLAGLTPGEVASVVLSAFKEWDERILRMAIGDIADEAYREEFEGAELISVGEPFMSGSSDLMFVPYRIKMPDKTVRSHNLALRRNSNGGWLVDGGL